jgi:predicted transposase/invertase (TIGR01784 family)
MIRVTPLRYAVAMPIRYLDPKVDLAFKRVFGEHKDLLRSFLNALLPLPEDAPIEDLEYLTPEQVPEVPGLYKNSIVDVKCRDTKGRTFIVEMQMLWSASFEQRMVFSASQAYVKQLRKGRDYDHLQPVYALALTNEIFDHLSDHFYHHYQIVNMQHPNKRILHGLQFIFIELPKFKPVTITEKRMQIKWLRFMNEVDETGDTLSDDLHQDSEIQAALQLLETASFTDSELDAYHSSIDKNRLEGTIIRDAVRKGQKEGKAEIVRALHANGMDEEHISQATQLSLTEIRTYLT